MVQMRVGERLKPLLVRALGIYRGELGDIIASIQKRAAAAALSPDEYVPPKLASEYERSTNLVEYVSNLGENARLFGADFHAYDLSIFCTALALLRDDLNRALQQTENDPLSPGEAAQPLRDQIEWITNLLDTTWQKYGHTAFLSPLRERRALKLGLQYPRPLTLAEALAAGEGQEIEFKERFPANANDIAKEMAAFGTSNAGTILLGIADDGRVVGLEDMQEMPARDALKRRIENLGSNTIRPALPARVVFEQHGEVAIARVLVPKGPEPVYYSNNIPYVRHGTASRPAQPQEVTQLVREWVERQRQQH